MLASFLVRSGKETQRQFFGYAFVRLDEELWRHFKDDREATAEKSVRVRLSLAPIAYNLHIRVLDGEKILQGSVKPRIKITGCLLEIFLS